MAALSARHVVDSVLLLERAPTWRRGGNSRHTRDIRYAHPAGEPFTTGEAYPVEELLDDLQRVGGGHNTEMADLVVEGSCGVAQFMTAHGVRWQDPLRGTLHLSRTNRFMLGGGKALVNSYYQTAESDGHPGGVRGVGGGHRARRSRAGDRRRGGARWHVGQPRLIAAAQSW